MNQETLILVAKLRRLAARQGKAFDVAQFVSDMAFAKKILSDVLDSDDDELLLTGLNLMKALGMTTITEASPHATAAIEPPEPAVSKIQGKSYVGRLR